MAQDLYHKLARHLDQLPGGYPATETGVELRILKRLFNEEHAALAVHLTLVPEPAAKIAARAGMKTAACVRLLQEMENQGLLFSLQKDGDPRYLAAQFVIGIWEYHVDSLDEELIRDVNEYLPFVMNGKTWKDAPQLRTIPVGASLDVEHAVLSYEQAEPLVDGKRKYLVAPCICRKEKAILGQGCGKPQEACLIFDAAADFYEKRGIGRVIDKTETLKILQSAKEHGLVLQPSNAKDVVSICLCCGCCCQVLKMLKRQPRPAEAFTSAFIAEMLAERCIGCALCLERCPMGALNIDDDRVVLDKGRCIGCGLCVSSCPSNALSLKRTARQPHVPDNARASLVNLGKTRIKVSIETLKGSDP